MLRINIFISLLSILFAFSACTEDSPILELPNTNDSSPNIIFIIADDMGWDAFGNYDGINSIKANKPTLDSLARNGITFTNYWVHSTCTPTRAAMLTGKYPFRTGVGAVGASLESNETIIQKYINNRNIKNFRK